MNAAIENAVVEEAREARAAYPETEPLPEYLSMMGLFTAVFVLFFVGRRKTPFRRISRLEHGLLMVLATHKLSRIVAKDRVTAPFRAPFARFEEFDGAGELEEDARGHGFRRAVGNLITCPYCVAPWIALMLKIVEKIAPMLAFHLISLLSTVAASDFLNQLYARLKDEG